MAAKSANVGGQNPEFVLREFQGMNTLNSRDTIDDNEFYWCENAIPVAPGSLYPVPGPSAALTTIAGETGEPSYTVNFNVNGTNYDFVVWSNSGNGWIVNLTTFAATKIITGLTSGQTAATQYSNQGLLIIDPTGYWDWNITTANTLTPEQLDLLGGDRFQHLGGRRDLTASESPGRHQRAGADRLPGDLGHDQCRRNRLCRGRLAHPDR